MMIYFYFNMSPTLIGVLGVYLNSVGNVSTSRKLRISHKPCPALRDAKSEWEVAQFPKTNICYVIPSRKGTLPQKCCSKIVNHGCTSLVDFTQSDDPTYIQYLPEVTSKQRQARLVLSEDSF